jgi:hypothetical protein
MCFAHQACIKQAKMVMSSLADVILNAPSIINELPRNNSVKFTPARIIACSVRTRTGRPAMQEAVRVFLRARPVQKPSPSLSIQDSEHKASFKIEKESEHGYGNA